MFFDVNSSIQSVFLAVNYSLTPVTLLSRGRLATRSSSSGVIKFVEPKCQTATDQKSNIIRCIRVWNVVADELNLRMNALNDFKQAMVEYNKTALSNYRTVTIPTLLSLSVLNAISVVVLPSLSRVVIMYSETSIKPTPN